MSQFINNTLILRYNWLDLSALAINKFFCHIDLKASQNKIGIPVAEAKAPNTVPLALFGLPFSNGGLEDAAQQCIKSIRHNNFDTDLFHATSFDSSLLAKIYGWRTVSINQAELLSICRRANISIATSKYLRTICRCLGSRLNHTFSLTDLLNTICEELSKKEKSIFTLGGKESITKAAAVKLHDHFNGLRLVGIATPLIFTEGEDLINAPERDALLVEQINGTQADMLIVNLGTPKQELWLERARHQLKTPLVFTVGNLLEKIAENDIIGSFKPPKEKSDDFQGGFFKKISSLLHGCASVIKIVWMSIPLLFYHTINRSVFQWFHESETSTAMPKDGRLFLSANRSIAFITLPQLIDETNVTALRKRIEEAFTHDVIILDFLQTRHIQPEGFHLLIEACQKRQTQNKEMYGFRSTKDIKSLMKVHRIWDLFKDYLCDTPEMLLTHLSHHEDTTSFYDTFMQDGDLVTISVLGSFNHRIDYEAYLKKITPIIGQKNCVLDLSCCTLVDNRGFSFLLNLRKHLQSQGHRLKLTGVSKALKRQFKSARVDNLL